MKACVIVISGQMSIFSVQVKQEMPTHSILLIFGYLFAFDLRFLIVALILQAFLTIVPRSRLCKIILKGLDKV